MKTLKYFYKIEDNKLIKGSGFKIPNGFIEYDINNKPEVFNEYELREEKNNLLTEIQSLADTKTQQAEAYVSQKTKITSEQIKRYQSKYNISKKYLETKDKKYEIHLKKIGEQLGLKQYTTIAKKIVSINEQWTEEINNFNLLIDYFRIELQKLVKNAKSFDDIEQINCKLNKLLKLDANATYDDIDNIIKSNCKE